MSEKPFASAEKSSGVRVVSEIAIEMRRAVIALAGEREWNETREAWLRRAAKRAGVSYRTARSFFYAEVSDPRASVVELVRAAVVAANKDRVSKLAEARREHEEIIVRIEALESRLRNVDQDFYRAELDAIGEAARRARGEDRAMDKDA